MMPRRVLVAGATGYIGRHTVQALLERGHKVVALARHAPASALAEQLKAGADVRVCDVTDASSLERDGLRGEGFDAVISCLASRTGAPKDAWAIDHAAQLTLMHAARAASATHFVLLSAICVQKPLLAFQHAKLAFEQALVESGLRYSIVRPTAFFKSLSGQIENLKRGRPFVVFGDGTLTACKPISEEDLAAFLADCLDMPDRYNSILPIGGPGPAITPRQQGELLFRLLGRPPRFRQVPVYLMDGIIGALSLLGHVAPRLADKAELGRIGRYYGTESMLVWNEERGYDADSTPTTGSDTLEAFYARVLAEGLRGQELGQHAVF